MCWTSGPLMAKQFYGKKIYQAANNLNYDGLIEEEVLF